jgi:hypothetical protein
MAVKWDISKLADAVKHAECYADVCRAVGLEVKGNNYDTIKRYINILQLDTSHFKSGIKLATERSKIEWSSVDDSEFFIVAERKRCRVKKRLLKYKSYQCELCNLSGVWNNKPLSLQLDHINGNSIDNRLENLRFLCPNCHSQTTTYAGKSSRQKPSQLDPNWRSREKLSTRKVARPSKEELQILIDTHTMVAIGKQFGVSDNAVRKWAKRYGIL